MRILFDHINFKDFLSLFIKKFLKCDSFKFMYEFCIIIVILTFNSFVSADTGYLNKENESRSVENTKNMLECFNSMDSSLMKRDFFDKEKMKDSGIEFTTSNATANTSSNNFSSAVLAKAGQPIRVIDEKKLLRFIQRQLWLSESHLRGLIESEKKIKSETEQRSNKLDLKQTKLKNDISQFVLTTKFQFFQWDKRSCLKIQNTEQNTKDPIISKYIQSIIQMTKDVSVATKAGANLEHSGSRPSSK